MVLFDQIIDSDEKANLKKTKKQNHQMPQISASDSHY